MSNDQLAKKNEIFNFYIESEVFSLNAYFCLGCSSYVTQKELFRRSKEINARLKINDIPVYDDDFHFIKPQRNIKIIKDSIQELSHPKSRLSHHFFWFFHSDESMIFFKKGSYFEAIDYWENEDSANKVNQFYSRKNIVLLETLLLYQYADISTVKEALLKWKNLVDEKNLWKAFEEWYFVQDEISCSSQIFKDFSKDMLGILSDIFTELSKVHANPSIYKEFTNTFNVSGKKIVLKVLTPIFEKLNVVSEKLENLNISEDGILDNDEKRAISKCVAGIESQISEIEKLGLKEDSSVRIVRDRAADAIRTVVLDMHNNLEETDYAEPVLITALEVAGTEGEKQRILCDLRVIQSIQKLSTVINFFKSEKYEEASREIDKLLKENPNDTDLIKTLIVKKQECILCQAAKLKEEGTNFFEKHNFSQSAALLTRAYELLDKNIGLFDFNEDMVRNEILAQVRTNVEAITIDNLEEINKIREEDITLFQEKFDTRHEGCYLILIYDTLFYSGLAEKIPKLKRKATTNAWVEEIIGLTIMLGIFIAIKACNG